MRLDDALLDVSVIGAGGKMGRGIAFLVAKLLADPAAATAGRAARLRLVDVSSAALASTASYIESQLRKHAQRRSEPERARRADDVLVGAAMGAIQTTARLEDAGPSRLVFEAVNEDEALKTKLLARLRELGRPDSFYLTNTSSVPIHALDDAAGLGGRIIGFHFYNPPAVQRLLELIPAASTPAALVALAEDLARRLGKLVVRSRDVAGFIGNGHFVREALHALEAATDLAATIGPPAAIWALNRVTEEWLLRPMGIFQLLDYVGIDVFRSITRVLSRHIPDERFDHPLLDDLLAAGWRGGAALDGAPRPGFLRYDGSRPVAALSQDRRGHEPIEPLVAARASAVLGAPPSMASWKLLRADPDRDSRIAAHLRELRRSAVGGSRIAADYLERSRAIARLLVERGVAAAAEDVDLVLTEGFQHLYGPLSPLAGGPTGA